MNIRSLLVSALLACIAVQVQACPSGQCERCAWGLCACFPDVACAVLPQEVLPSVGGLPSVIAPGPRLKVSTIENAVNDVSATVSKAFNDVNMNLAKSSGDAKAEAGRFGRELQDAGGALVEYARGSAEGIQDAATQLDRRLRQGKVVDAIWHAALSPIQVQEKSASEAVLESEYLRGIGQVAATAYGGPQGAAAYSAWLAYRQSGGNAALAFRVGILTGATAAAFGSANAIDGTARRAVVTGAIGGLAVAAAGGDAQAVQEAFLNAGAMVVIQDGFREVSGHVLDGKASSKEAYCITATSENCTPLPKEAIAGTDEKGNFIVDMSKVDPTVQAVGLKDHTAYFSEANKVMDATSKIPGMQGMAVFHDAWAVKWDMGALATPATIMPAIVLTYVGLGAPFYDQIQKTAVDEALSSSGGPCCGGGATQGRESPVAFKAVDAHVGLVDDGVQTVVVHEQRHPKAPRWCSGKSETYLEKTVSVPTQGKLTFKFERTGCIRPGKLGNAVEFVRPSAVDKACRVLVMTKGAWKVASESLFDRDACTASVSKEVSAASKSGEVRWYRGDARTALPSAPAMTKTAK